MTQLRTQAFGLLLCRAAIAGLGAIAPVAVAQANERVVVIEVWADNWFEVFVNGELVLTDPVPITTERSFNAESLTLSIDVPAQVSIKARDFTENDTGLEYIGTPRQQMGDGGLIAQVTDAASGDVLAATDANTRCFVVHRAPLDPACATERAPIAGEGSCTFSELAEPEGWASLDFEDEGWPSAITYSEDEVSPRRGYRDIVWTEPAALIWSDSLLLDNALLCRLPRIE
ncbi:PEBP family protein [Roseobacter sinensis]|uniref:PEBP family protein n=1 Tax=Roseobacter sinensis TaxID=2931391 RepID=A0ABT3B9B3_9RHOB|nr:PEBP family protein [Roseobacter sp. WL0113]MCV3270171.1 PEBP family protein [Roseobacter sp. WL0113]